MMKSWYDWDWAGSELEAKRAIELNPNLERGRAHLPDLYSAEACGTQTQYSAGIYSWSQ